MSLGRAVVAEQRLRRESRDSLEMEQVAWEQNQGKARKGAGAGWG